MHKAFSLPANSGYRVGMKETDGKLHVSKTSVRRLIPRRNCTAVSSQVRVWQEELAELRNSTTGNSPPSTLCWSKGRALRVQILGHFFLLGITLLLHHGFEREMFCPRTQPTPFSARSQLKSSGTRTAAQGRAKPETCLVRNPGLPGRNIPPPHPLVWQSQVSTNNTLSFSHQ